MKKSGKTLLSATLLTFAFNMASCDSGYQNVYGPPPDTESEPSEISAYDPHDEPCQPEYGVYEYYKDDVTGTTEEITTAEIREYNPEDEEPAVVYGPPSCFGIKEK
ncbi:MAG: hypothetical protein K2G83_04075, partial [Ruminococcus sp.]|nr:hypothetical protein [Ruminococcus sp.]